MYFLSLQIVDVKWLMITVVILEKRQTASGAYTSRIKLMEIDEWSVCNNIWRNK